MLLTRTPPIQLPELKLSIFSINPPIIDVGKSMMVYNISNLIKEAWLKILTSTYLAFAFLIFGTTCGLDYKQGFILVGA